MFGQSSEQFGVLQCFVIAESELRHSRSCLMSNRFSDIHFEKIPLNTVIVTTNKNFAVAVLKFFFRIFKKTSAL